MWLIFRCLPENINNVKGFIYFNHHHIEIHILRKNQRKLSESIKNSIYLQESKFFPGNTFQVFHELLPRFSRVCGNPEFVGVPPNP